MDNIYILLFKTSSLEQKKTSSPKCTSIREIHVDTHIASHIPSLPSKHGTQLTDNHNKLRGKKAAGKRQGVSLHRNAHCAQPPDDSLTSKTFS